MLLLGLVLGVFLRSRAFGEVVFPIPLPVPLSIISGWEQVLDVVYLHPLLILDEVGG